MSSAAGARGHVLGIDLGVESVGWALVRIDGHDKGEIVRIGAHTFDPGVKGQYESGRDQSRAAARREARQPRRQHWRRAWRRKKLLRTLQRAGLLPDGSLETPDDIHALILNLDRQLLKRHVSAEDNAGHHLLPYILRKKAVEQQLEPYEVGRALYHLAQRRGFLSNRKAARKDDDEGVVKAGISELAEKIRESGAPTLGAYLSTLDPREERIRRRWTSRQMYLDEFEAIWSNQTKYHASLSPELKDRIHTAIFHQRPLKSQSHLIGRCELYPTRRRAHLALRITQHFRLLQAVNNLRIYSPDGIDTALTPDQRAKLIEALETQGDRTFPQIRKLLGLKKGTSFNLEEGGEKRIPGNRTNAALIAVFGDRWQQLTEAERDQIVEDVLTYEKADALARRGRERWGLDSDAAKALAEVHLEDDHARHCRKALEQLVDRMKDGTPYATARRELFPEAFEAVEALDQLPPVTKTITDLRNPAVCRSLTELRKLVNAIVREHGKPDEIHVELATDLKRPRKLRQEISKRNRQREQEREQAAKAIMKEFPGLQPRRADIDKYLLAEECGWVCPYTGKQINMRSLFGDSPQFDIEHILPMSRSLDNSFVNKTLCDLQENRDVKQNRTPFEAYNGHPEKYEQVLERVQRFKSGVAREKLRRFNMEDIPDDFTNRHLQDTRYASRLAADYLGKLYGGRADADGRLRIQVSAGGVTAFLRNQWMLNGILNDGDAKTRDDHRHHAVDALTVALATPSAVKQLSDAADRSTGRRLFAGMQMPWPDFIDDVRRAVANINVSRRISRKLAGPLHKETNYSKPQPSQGSKDKAADCHHIRKPLVSLSAGDIERIVDPEIRRLVKEKLAAVAGPPSKVFTDPANHPVLSSRKGLIVPIHKARIRVADTLMMIGKGSGQRWVAPGSNHHMAIVAELDADENEVRWTGELVSRFEAVRRAREGIPVVQRDWGERCRFKFSLASGETFVLQSADLTGLFVVRTISGNSVEFARSNDARKKEEIKSTKQWYKRSLNVLRDLQCCKVRITHLGVILRTND